MQYRKKYSRAFAPASVSNVGPGFDTFGFPIYDAGDEVEVFVSSARGVKIKNITGSEILSRDAGKNTAGVAARSLLKSVKAEFGIELILHKKLPIGSGLGSSAASAVAAVMAVNDLFRKPLPKEELLLHALRGEAVASGGSLHADNVLPSLMGGFNIIRGIIPFDFTQLKIAKPLYCMVLHPDIIIETKVARSMLPAKIPVASAVRQAANAGTLVAALLTGNFTLLRKCTTDQIAEPYRSKLIPGYEEFCEAATKSGAFGFNISGSGPSVFAFYRTKKEARNALPSLAGVFQKRGLKVLSYISGINDLGAVIL